jgi:hypothetical protein
MLKLIVTIAIVCLLAYCGATVKLGNKTFFQHVKAIWATEEVKELKDGIEEKAAPAADKVKRGVKAGLEAAEGKDKGSQSPEAAPAQ